ncbi:MAG: hypothetical protein U9N58_01930 [Thermodesulfobacteriota bacterium]|nr:hypothetical protein [Thermodesulfobacteriota bacterium]
MLHKVTVHGITTPVLPHHRTVSVYRVLQMRGVGIRRHTPCTSSTRPACRQAGNKADAVPCERLP